MNADSAKIHSVVKSFGALADQSAFEYLGSLFTKAVTVDYTSAFGGEPAVVERQDLMTQWAALLPGFDVTYHDISDVNIDYMKDKAKVVAKIKASHFLGEDGFWQITGTYVFVMKKVDEQWLICSLTLISNGESGSRDVLAKAGEKAKHRLSERQARALKL